jgi:hypothetical protein
MIKRYFLSKNIHRYKYLKSENCANNFDASLLANDVDIGDKLNENTHDMSFFIS